MPGGAEVQASVAGGAPPRVTADPRAAERLIEQVPPHNEDAEAAVLGSMLLDRDAISSAIERTTAEDFYVPAHQVIYQVMVDLYDHNRPVDLVTMTEELSRLDRLDDVGGAAYLAGLAEATPSAVNAEYYADIVRDKGLLREVIRAAEEIRRDALESREETAEVLDQCEKRIFNVIQRRQTGQTIALRDILRETFEHIDRSHDREGRLTGLSTGFFALDDLTLGFQPGELIVLAARPSMGKTSLALNISESVGVEQGRGVVVFSLEMSKQQVAQNMLCSRARVNGQLLRKGMLSDRQMQELTKYAGELSEAPVFIDDSPGMTPLEIRAKARRLALHHDVALVVVDYLQLMEIRGANRNVSREQQVASMSRSLKALARELEIPVLALSQLNRAPDAREDHRPRMSDLRESGAIEQDADVVMMLHRDDQYDPEKNPGEAVLDVVKQRNGPTDRIPLVFLHQFTRFENAAPQRDA